MDGRRSCLGGSGYGNDIVVLHMEALKRGKENDHDGIYGEGD